MDQRIQETKKSTSVTGPGETSVKSQGGVMAANTKNSNVNQNQGKQKLNTNADMDRKTADRDFNRGSSKQGDIGTQQGSRGVSSTDGQGLLKQQSDDQDEEIDV